MNPGLQQLWATLRATVLDKRVPPGIGLARALGTASPQITVSRAL